MEDFSIFIPVDIIEKADSKKDKDGLPEKLCIGGVASNSKTGFDKDDQHLDVNGFDYQPLLKSGFLNLEHAYTKTKDASMIVGEPTNAWVKDNEFHVEGVLYKDNPKAVALYKLATALKKAGSSRKIGYSIEGSATEYNPADKRKVTKAVIKHLALTISPKCDGTNMTLLKGGDSYELQKDSEFLIDIVDGETRYTVDKDLNIIEKAMDTGSTPGKETVEDKSGKALSAQEASDSHKPKEVKEINKAMTAGAVTGRDTTDQSLTQEPLKEESVDGVKKKKKKKDESDVEKQSFSKSEIYIDLFSIFNLDVESAKHVYGLAEKIQRQLTPDMAEVTKISKEAIQKAEEILGLIKAEDVVVDAAAEAKKKADELKKAETDKLQGELDVILKKAEEIKNKIEGKETTAVEQTATVIATPDAELVKANAKIDALAILFKASGEDNDELRKANGELKASIGKIEEFTTALSKKLGMIAEQPLDRKSVSTVSFLEKGGEGAANNGIKVMSISNKKHKAEVADVLYKAAEASEFKDTELVKATQFVELGSFPNQQFAQRIQARLLKEHKIQLVK